jgi:tetrahydromethanopterin S-methyltransferase subunit G
MAMNLEAEIRDLKRRVSEIEGSCGEGTFGFLAYQISTFHKDLLAFQEKTEQRFDQIDTRFDRVDGRLDKIDSRLDHVDPNFRELRTDLRKIVSDTMREVLAEQSRKKP